MIDFSNLLKILQINDLNEKSSSDEIEAVFKVIGYSQEDRNEAIHLLKTNGWLGEQKVEIKNIPETEQVSNSMNPVAFANVPPIAPVDEIIKKTPTPKNYNSILTSIVIIIFISLTGTLTYFAYAEKIGPFKSVEEFKEKSMKLIKIINPPTRSRQNNWRIRLYSPMIFIFLRPKSIRV